MDIKIILNILTHGDELIGLRVAEEIKKYNIDEKNLKINRANQKAYELKKRYVDSDLNRAFPGDNKGDYEHRLAKKITKIIEKADLVIDIHSTTSELKDAICVTKLDNDTKKIIDIISPKYVLLVETIKDCILISKAKVGIVFEYGKDDDSEVLQNIVRDIKKILIHYKLIKEEKIVHKENTKIFNMIQEVPKPHGFKLLPEIENYKLVKKGQIFAQKDNEVLKAEFDFYPLIFANDNYDEIFGFAGIEIKTNS